MLESQGFRKKFSDGATIFKQGDSADEMYVIRSGRVRIVGTKKGKETTLTVLGPGDFFGEMGILNDSPRSASAQAVGDTELQLIDKASFERQVSEPVVWDMLKKMSQRIREIDERVEELSSVDQLRQDHLQSISTRNSWLV